MTECTVARLTVHPVKSLRGQSVDQLEISPMGIVGDRELMILHEGEPLVQKHEPRMARVAAAWLPDGRLRLDASGRAFIHTRRGSGDAIAAKLHYNEIETCDQGDAVADWLSETLGKSVRLVSLPRPWKRWIPLPAFSAVDGQPQDRFYDASPVLVNVEASLQDLNDRLAEAIPVDRFRGNVLLSGLPAYAEDDLEHLGTDRLDLAKVSVCERCIAITTDQQTGDRSKEPLNTLNTYRRREDAYASGIVFGAYMRVTKAGTLRVGDRVTALP